ncbi:MAG: helix-turn-helix domain-containing protein [Rubrivivax sp.]
MMHNPVVKLSFAVEPFVSIVQRHVKVSARARQAIVRDLAEALGQADVQIFAATAPAQAPDEAADAVLTTEQAARLAGVSRPFMVKLIDTGAVELHQKVGNQRRVLRSAVVRWQATEHARQAKSLKRLAKDLDEEIFAR